MPTQRVSMRNLREVCRLRFKAHLNLRQNGSGANILGLGCIGSRTLGLPSS